MEPEIDEIAGFKATLSLPKMLITLLAAGLLLFPVKILPSSELAEVSFKWVLIMNLAYESELCF